MEGGFLLRRQNPSIQNRAGSVNLRYLQPICRGHTVHFRLHCACQSVIAVTHTLSSVILPCVPFYADLHRGLATHCSEYHTLSEAVGPTPTNLADEETIKPTSWLRTMLFVYSHHPSNLVCTLLQ